MSKNPLDDYYPLGRNGFAKIESEKPKKQYVYKRVIIFGMQIDPDGPLSETIRLSKLGCLGFAITFAIMTVFMAIMGAVSNRFFSTAPGPAPTVVQNVGAQ
ncbi:hypothetical protein ACH6CV_05040 [Bacillota bacterium Meth-B3]